MHAIWYKSYNLGKGMGEIKFWGIKREIIGIKLYKAIDKLWGTWRHKTDNHLGNLCRESHCSIV